MWAHVCGWMDFKICSLSLPADAHVCVQQSLLLILLLQIAMTFNVGLFCAVVLGYVLGAFFFASLPENYSAHLQVSKLKWDAVV